MNSLRERAAGLRQALGPPRERRAPVETGKRLATVQRDENTELRVVWDEYEGKPYLALRIWERRDGAWYPTQKGVTVRLRELPSVADGIAAALDEAERYTAQRGHQATTRPPSRPGAQHFEHDAEETGRLF